MNNAERHRYSRQICLPEVGEAGQQRLLDSRVLVLGLGGLGSPVALYLAAAGVGHLVVSDYDWVDESNLQRQVIHRHADIGESKTTCARRTLLELNPALQVDAIDHELDDDELLQQARAAEVLVDCTDNFPSRFALNRASLATGVPLVSGAAIRWQGQLAAFFPARADSPCYACLYPDESVEGLTCAAEGVIAPLVGVIGSMQALWVLRVLLFDALASEWQTMPLARRPDCPRCAGRA